MKNKNIILTIIFVLILTFSTTSARKGERKHKCQQDKIQQQLNELKKQNPVNKRRMLNENDFVLGLEAEPAPIRITVSYNLDDVESAEFIELVQKSMAVSTKYLSDVFWVLPESDPIVITQEYTDDEATGKMSICKLYAEVHNVISAFPADLESGGITDSDLHLIVESDNNTDEDYLAYAASCQSHHGRSTVGLVNFNQGYFDQYHDGSDHAFEHYVEIAIHEIFHVFGFNSDNFKDFRSPTGKKYDDVNYIVVNNEKQTLLITPEVRRVAQEHYDCDTIPGAFIENGGGGGSALSHWEQTYLFNEMMNPTSVQSDSVVSDFTLSFFRDSNWYQFVDFSYSETLHWGKQKGCLFFNSCDFPEFSSEAEICTYYHFGKGTPHISPFFNQCPVQMAAQDCQIEISSDEYAEQDITLEKFSEQSKCFESTFQLIGEDATGVFNTRCYQQECIQDGILITITNGNTDYELTCTTNSEVLEPPVGSGLEGQLTCPDNLQLYCDFPIPCPNYCSQNGYCLRQNGEGHCNCVDGFAGDDCSIECDTVVDNTNTCQLTCQTGQYISKGTKICMDCDECDNCTGPNADDCQTCPQGEFGSGGSCVSSCPDGQFGDLTTGECAACDGSCTNGCVKFATNCIIVPQAGSEAFEVPNDISSQYVKAVIPQSWDINLDWCPGGAGTCDCSLLNEDCISCSSTSPQCLQCRSGYNPETNCQNTVSYKSCFENDCCSFNIDCVECSSSCTKCNPNWYLSSGCEEAIDEELTEYDPFLFSSCFINGCQRCANNDPFDCVQCKNNGDTSNSCATTVSEQTCTTCCHIHEDCQLCVGNTCLQCNPGFDPHYQCMYTSDLNQTENCEGDCNCSIFGPDCMNCDLELKICLECKDNKDPQNNCRSYNYYMPCQVNGCCHISPFCGECSGNTCETCSLGVTLESGCTMGYDNLMSLCSGIEDEAQIEQCIEEYYSFDCQHIDECFLCYNAGYDVEQRCVQCKAPYNPFTNCNTALYDLNCQENDCCSINNNCILCEGGQCIKCNPGYDVDNNCADKIHDWTTYVYDTSKNTYPENNSAGSSLLSFTIYALISSLLLAVY